eukprot:CAMPEP_0198260840 /NCGR_PEP_ID=MMETSP1447-20131203/9711_1 /TAXON_ID=420782 /ORGANISM="Chaetoceros dichaeta, Strain CCMP1751" /LENGTH=98 /DNA_ID=CAMNT_0043948585 /DNA_START=31 /DNA_END=324 /DNA_ORIENTATION=+
MRKAMRAQAHNIAFVDALKQKIEDKQTLAISKKEIVLKNVATKSIERKEKYTKTTAEAIDAEKVKQIDAKMNRKQNLAIDNKEKLVSSITSKIHEKME